MASSPDEGPVSIGAEWHSRPIGDIKGLDLMALLLSVKPWGHTRKNLCRRGLASCGQIFKVALILSHSVDKVGFRWSKIFDDNVMPALALAASYIVKASRACALNCATEGLV